MLIKTSSCLRFHLWQHSIRSWGARRAYLVCRLQAVSRAIWQLFLDFGLSLAFIVDNPIHSVLYLCVMLVGCIFEYLFRFSLQCTLRHHLSWPLLNSSWFCSKLFIFGPRTFILSSVLELYLANRFRLARKNATAYWCCKIFKRYAAKIWISFLFPSRPLYFACLLV